MPKPKIAILCPFPHGGAPAQRFRFEQYIPALERAGFDVAQLPFWDHDTVRVLYEPGHFLRKVRGTLAGFGRRALAMPEVLGADFVFVHLEATPLGPPIFEALALALGKRVIYDIDDAIFIPKTSSANRIVAGLRWRSKVAFLTRHAYRVTAVNRYVEAWARDKKAAHVVLIPTTLDLGYHRPTGRRRPNPVPVIGWTGTHSTAPFLEIVRPVLRELDRTHEFVFRVICDRDPGFSELERYEFVRWRKETEIEDLEAFDVGLMPVHDEEFSKGKVGFKAIQYSALQIPTVASDVGSGRDVVDDGVTGYVVPNDPAAWLDRLRTLLERPDLRASMGARALEHIRGVYTVDAQTPRYVDLFT
jgi:glycosyltransferase involved in cell wall biosynthesis